MKNLVQFFESYITFMDLTHSYRFRCGICAKDLNAVDSLRNHLRNHEIPQANNIECSICKMKLSTKVRLTIHMRKKHGVCKALNHFFN